MATYYHVADGYDGGDLESLARRLGSEADAVEQFCEKWGDSPANAALAFYHVHYIHLYDTIEQAEGHPFGGNILAIEITDDDYIDIKRDELEFDHPMVRDIIPADLIKVIA